jgi:hypothetical protein
MSRPQRRSHYHLFGAKSRSIACITGMLAFFPS